MTRRNSNNDRSGDAEQGILLESDGKSGVALTRDGRFVMISCRPGDEEGQEVPLSRETAFEGHPDRPARARVRPGLRSLRPGFAVAAALILCVLLASPFAVGRVLASGDPVAYVSVDINPSLEFGVNRWDRVVSAEALDADGEAVLADVDWAGRLLDGVLEDVAAVALDLGYLQEGESEDEGAFLVTTVPVGEGREVPPGLEKRLERARTTVSDLLTGQGCGATVETIYADAAGMREQARQLGLSVGRYSILLVAQEAGLDLEAADLSGGLGRVIHEAGGQPGEVLREAHAIRTMSRLAAKWEKHNGVGPGNSQGRGPDDNPGASGGEGNGRGPDDGSDPGGQGDQGPEDGVYPASGNSDNNGNGNGKGNGHGNGKGNGHGKGDESGNGNDKGNLGSDGSLTGGEDPGGPGAGLPGGGDGSESGGVPAGDDEPGEDMPGES